MEEINKIFRKAGQDLAKALIEQMKPAILSTIENLKKTQKDLIKILSVDNEIQEFVIEFDKLCEMVKSKGHSKELYILSAYFLKRFLYFNFASLSWMKRAFSDDLKHNPNGYAQMLYPIMQDAKEHQKLQNPQFEERLDQSIEFLKGNTKTLYRSKDPMGVWNGLFNIFGKASNTKISEADTKKFRENSEEERKNPLFLEDDGKNIITNIADQYETTRYLNGLLISLFDAVDTSSIFDFESYFDKDITVYPDVYHYKSRANKELTKDRIAYNFLNLEDYLKKYSSSFPKMQAILKWIYDDDKIRFIRNSTCHNKRDVIQDKLENQIWKFYSNKGTKEYSIEDLIRIESRLDNLLYLIRFSCLILFYEFIVEENLKSIK